MLEEAIAKVFESVEKLEAEINKDYEDRPLSSILLNEEIGKIIKMLEKLKEDINGNN